MKSVRNSVKNSIIGVVIVCVSTFKVLSSWLTATRLYIIISRYSIRNISQEIQYPMFPSLYLYHIIFWLIGQRPREEARQTATQAQDMGFVLLRLLINCGRYGLFYCSTSVILYFAFFRQNQKSSFSPCTILPNYPFRFSFTSLWFKWKKRRWLICK